MLNLLKKVAVFFRLIGEHDNTLSITSLAAYMVLYKIIQAPNVGLTEIGAFLIAMLGHQMRAQRGMDVGIGVKDKTHTINPPTNPNGQLPNDQGHVSNLTSGSSMQAASQAVGMNLAGQRVEGGGGVAVVGPEGSGLVDGGKATSLQIKALIEDVESLKARVGRYGLTKALFPQKK